ncbi:MAG: ABC transporter permease, partial [Candidatus Hydrogenedentes bacterium]|nr:ABC transporter permease [Candidatus Hydrogenedentota bacterium]
NVPPLVVTLATMTLFRGIAMGLSKGDPIGNLPDGLTWLSQGDAFRIPAGEAGPVFFPVPLFPLVFVFGAGILVLRKTWFGRFTECIGENETAAEFAAIDTRRVKLALYTLCGVVCGVGAVFQTALYNTAKANTALGMELEVIACVVIGGTRISGGRASMIGTLLGLLLIGILRYGLDMARVQQQYIIILVGCLLIAAAVFNEWMAGGPRGR